MLSPTLWAETVPNDRQAIVSYSDTNLTPSLWIKSAQPPTATMLCGVHVCSSRCRLPWAGVLRGAKLDGRVKLLRMLNKSWSVPCYMPRGIPILSGLLASLCNCGVS